MSYWAPSGATLAIAANATSGTILGDMSAYPVTPGMAIAPGSRSGIDGPSRIITSWAPTTSPVGATFTIDGAFSGSVAFAAGTPFVIDNLATPGSVLAQNNLAVSTLLNALKKWFGLSTTLDQASKSLPFDRAAGAGTYTELTFLLAARKWFGWEHRTVSGTERLLGRTYVDGATATDSIDINGSDGTVDYKIGESTIAAAATTNLGTGRTRKVIITGNTGITSFGSTPNLERVLRFTGSPTITHNATSLIIPGAANITVAAGDTMRVTSDAAGNWCILSWTRASGSVAFAPLAAPNSPAGTGGSDGIMSAADKTRVDGMPTGQNLVPNGSLERGLSNWTQVGLTAATFAVVAGATDAPAPNYARLTLNSQNSGNPRLDGQKFPIVPGRQYLWGCWTRANKNATAANNTQVIRINWVKGDGTSSSTPPSSISVVSSTAWTWVENALTAPADAVYAYFTALVSAANAASDTMTWLDVTGMEIKEVLESNRLFRSGTISNASLVNMLPASVAGGPHAGLIKGRISTDGAPQDLTPAQVRTIAGLWTSDKPTFAGVNLTGNLSPKAYTVATLPTSGNVAGDVVFATNCRAFNGAGTQETAGNGTGALVVWVTSPSNKWNIIGTNVTAVA